MSTKQDILYFVPEFPMLSQTFIEREVSTLIKLNNTNLTVFSFKKASGATSEDVLRNTVFRRLKFADILKALIFVTRNYQSVLNELRWTLRFMPAHTGIWLFIKAIGYASIFKTYNPTHIHVNFLSDISTLIKISAGVLQIPFSISAHAKDVFVNGHLISEKIKVAKFITICNSNTYNEVVSIAEDQNIAHTNVHLLFHGVPMFDAAQDEVNSYKNDVPLVVSLGRFVEKKGYKYVFEAIKLLRDKGISTRLIIAGFGPLHKELVQNVQELNLAETIEILGSEDQGVPNQKIRTLLKAADVFVAAYIEGQDGDVDGIANVIVEAALARIPAVVTDSGGVTDLHDKTSALIIGQKDSKAIAESIEKILSNKKFAEQLADNAYNLAVNRFDLKSNVSKLEKLIIDTP